MSHRDWCNLDAPYKKRLMINWRYRYVRDRRAGRFNKAECIGERAAQDINSFLHGVDLNCTPAAERIWTQVVETSDVVKVMMRVDHAIKLQHTMCKHLLSEIC